MDLQPLKQLMAQALTNDQKISASEFTAIKTEILKDQQHSPAENQVLIDALTLNQFDAKVVPSVIAFVAEHLPDEDSEPKTAEQKAPEPTPVAIDKVPEQKIEKAQAWKKEYTIQGNFNHTSVSSGWTGQYGTEKTSTRVEGSFQAQLNYEEGRTSWKNRVLAEYGNNWVKGEEQTTVSRNNLEITSEAAYKVGEQGNLKIEIPYVSLYTKGPITEMAGRKFRETTGAKLTYTTDDKQGEYSAKVGVGVQQTNDIASGQWNNEIGAEMVLEAKQTLSFMKAPIIQATGIKAENVTFLDRLEVSGQVNAFNPMQNGVDLKNTDVGVRVSGRYYINEKKSIWVGGTQQYQYGGRENSTWEQKFSGDLGFKF
jgi:hypothetical protein